MFLGNALQNEIEAMNRRTTGREKFPDGLKEFRCGLHRNVLENRDGENRSERGWRESLQVRFEIAADDSDIGKTGDVLFILRRTVSKTVVGIDQGDVVAKLIQEATNNRFAAADFEQTSGWRHRAKKRFHRPRALHVFKIAVQAGNVGQVIETFAIVAHRGVACLRHWLSCRRESRDNFRGFGGLSKESSGRWHAL